MTAVAFVPTGHPVRRFVVAIVALAITCLVVWWSAVLMPRITVDVEQFNIVTRDGVLLVTNDGPTPVDVDGVRVEPGETARVAAVVPAECEAPIRVRARTVAGITRTVETDGLVACHR